MAIAAFKNLRFVDFASLPDRTNRMNHVTGFELASGGCNGLPSRQSTALFTDLFAFGQKAWPGSVMDCAIHAASAKQARVGGVDDCVSRFMGDVTHQQLKSCTGTDSVSQN